MSPADLSTTNVWLAVIAFASVLQLLVIVGLLVGAARFFRRIEATIDRITEQHIAPISVRANEVLDEMEDVMARVQSFDDGMRRTLSRVGVGVSVATSVMRSRFWPVVGVLRGLKAGLASLKRASLKRAPGDRPPRRSGKVTKFAPTRLAPKDASDLEAEQRFAYEGGMSHARG
jgi:hypothetical protein